LQVTATIIAGESSIRKYPEGAATLETISKAGLSLLKWRASADYRKELKALRNVFGVCALIFTGLFILIGSDSSSKALAAMTIIFSILWMAMFFGSAYRESIKAFLSSAAFFGALPWLMLYVDYFQPYKNDHINEINSIYKLGGIIINSPLEVTIYTSFFMFVAFGIGAIMWILFLSLIASSFLCLIGIASIISRRALVFSPRLAYNLALIYCYIIGPTLIGLESKGII